MSSNIFTHITFDASISDCGSIGIGIHDIKRKETIGYTYTSSHKSNNSFEGEKMALLCSMEYAYSKSYKHLNLFTDNLSLATSGIPNHFLEKFPFESCTLTWIPRELNKEADKVSKQYRQDKESTKIHPQTNSISKSQSLFNKYSYERKLAFLTKHFSRSIDLITDKQNSEFLRMLKSGEKGHYSFNNDKVIVPILSMTKLMFTHNEHPPYIKKRIKGIKLSGKTLIKPMTLERFKSLTS